MAKIDKLLGQLAEHLENGERVDAAVAGTYETKIMGSDSVRTGIMAATDRRLVFYAKKLMGFEIESFPYANISSFEASKGMMGHAFRFAASGNDVHLKWVNAGDVPGFTAIMRERAGQRPPALPEVAAAQPLSPVEELRQLAELRDAGIVTPEEFEAKKRQLLGL
jgi:hypothetical protein